MSKAGARAAAGASAARARRRPGAVFLPALRRQARQAGRGHHRDAGSDPAPAEGDPDRAGEVLLSGLRDRHPAAGAVPSDRPRASRRQPAGDDPGRQVRSARRQPPRPSPEAYALVSTAAVARWADIWAPASSAPSRPPSPAQSPCPSEICRSRCLGSPHDRAASATPATVKTSAAICESPSGSCSAIAETTTPITGTSIVPIAATEASRRSTAPNHVT